MIWELGDKSRKRETDLRRLAGGEGARGGSDVERKNHREG